MSILRLNKRKMIHNFDDVISAHSSVRLFAAQSTNGKRLMNVYVRQVANI